MSYTAPPPTQKVQRITYVGNGSKVTNVIPTSFTPKRVVIYNLNVASSIIDINYDATGNQFYSDSYGFNSNAPNTSAGAVIFLSSGIDVGQVYLWFNEFNVLNDNYVMFVYG